MAVDSFPSWTPFTQRVKCPPNRVNFNELLAALSETCPRLQRPYKEYKQEYGHQIECADHFAKEYATWARSEQGQAAFPTDIHDLVAKGGYRTPYELYLKFQAAQHLIGLTPSKISSGKVKKKRELSSLQQIFPHTIVTTNYDTFVQTVFPEYTPIIGNQILRSRGLTIGEVFQVHGSTSEPPSLVLTRKDYDLFKERRKYLVAKLLTFFVEHPLLFIGYGHNDPNIREILGDLGELEQSHGGVVPNIYILEWRRRIPQNENFESEATIEVATHRYVRVKKIVAANFDWVYRAFASRSPMGAYRVKPLRALLARVTKIVRRDVPAQKLEVNFQTLQGLLDDDGELNHILGVSQIGDGRDFNLSFRHTISEVAEMLNYTHWTSVKNLVHQIHKEQGVLLHEFDNRYHQAVKTGRSAKSITHKYSDEFVALLRKVQSGQEYELDLDGDAPLV